MEIQIDVDDEVIRIAREKASEVGLTLERVIEAYLRRIAEDTEPVTNEFLPDGTLRSRALREQIYRL